MADDLRFFGKFKNRGIVGHFCSKRSAIRNRTMNTVLNKQTAIIAMAKVFADENIDMSCMRIVFLMSAVMAIELPVARRCAVIREIAASFLSFSVHGFKLYKSQACCPSFNAFHSTRDGIRAE